VNDCGLDGIHLLNKSVPRPLSARGEKAGDTHFFGERPIVIANASVPQSPHGFRWKALNPYGFSAQRASPKSAQGRVRGTYDPPNWFARVACFVSPKSQTIARRERRPGKGRKPKPIRPKGAALNESSLEVKRRIAVPGICRNYIQSPPTWLASRRCGFFPDFRVPREGNNRYAVNPRGDQYDTNPDGTLALTESYGAFRESWIHGIWYGGHKKEKKPDKPWRKIRKPVKSKPIVQKPTFRN
jgi:hypothetical protein